MKKVLLTTALVAVCAGAFAQGRVNVLNDANSLVTFTTNTGLLLPQDAGLAGSAVGDATTLPSGVTLMAGLYGGTSSTALFLYSSTTLNVSADPAGYVPAFHVVLTSQTDGAPAIAGIASGTAIGASTPWFQVKVWNNAYATYDAALAAGAYTGSGAMFQLNPSTSAIAYTGTTPPGANSTWTEAPIVVSLVPEPSTFALAGLGAAAALILRRRK